MAAARREGTVMLVRVLAALLTAGMAFTATAGVAAPVPVAHVADGFVHFAPAVPFERGLATVRAAGLVVAAPLPAAHAVYAIGGSTALARAARRPEVVRLEPVGRVLPALDTAGDATRARAVYAAASPLRDDVGAVIDGRGVGIAVIDSGIDGSHPDLPADPEDGAPKVVRNFKVLCSPPFVGTAACRDELHLVEMEDTDTTEGHGTGVAGVAAGGGAASGGRFLGVAPGAKLYGFGVGDALQGLPLANIAIAYQWIHDHGAHQDPPIRVLNNSWASFGPFDPNSVVAKLTGALVRDRGITVVFAAGNRGGTGGTDQTNGYGKHPLPGVLQVASYDDGDTGSRQGTLAIDSSRGAANDPATWPDVSAPGEGITAPCKAVAIFCTFNLVTASAPYYARLSGTSYAAPHAAGVVALLYQAEPDLTPAEAEDLIEDAAHHFPAGGAYTVDPSNPDSLSSFDKGHGLVDAFAAVEAALRLEDPES